MCGVPLLLTQTAFRRHAAIRATHRETIASLARATEVAGYTPVGHARRVSALSHAMGRELGLGGKALAALEHAALMHDIGQLSLVDPVPGGATSSLDQVERRRIALLGAEVVRRTGAPRKSRGSWRDRPIRTGTSRSRDASCVRPTPTRTWPGAVRPWAGGCRRWSGYASIPRTNTTLGWLRR